MRSWDILPIRRHLLRTWHWALFHQWAVQSTTNCDWCWHWIRLQTLWTTCSPVCEDIPCANDPNLHRTFNVSAFSCWRSRRAPPPCWLETLIGRYPRELRTSFFCCCTWRYDMFVGLLIFCLISKFHGPPLLRFRQLQCSSASKSAKACSISSMSSSSWCRWRFILILFLIIISSRTSPLTVGLHLASSDLPALNS